MTARGRAALAASVLATVLTVLAAGCSSSASSTTNGAAQGNYSGRVATALVQCFADHHLIPAASLNPANSGYGSSTWLSNGKVTENDDFGDWYRDVGAGVLVHGKIIGEWVSEIDSNARAWPASICGPMPHV